MNPNLVILAGGVSSRMRRTPDQAAEIDPQLLHQAAALPKSLIGAGQGGRPLMDYLLYNAREAGCTDVVLLVGKNNAAFRECYGTADRLNPFHGMTISYAIQEIPVGRTKPLGTADALLQALRSRSDWRGQSFTVCNSDNLYSRDAFRMLLASPCSGAMIDYDRSGLQFAQSRIEAFAVTIKDTDGFIMDIIEKPNPAQLAEAADTQGRIGVSMNIFRFSYDTILPVLENVPLNPVRLEKELPTAVKMLIAEDPRAMKAIPLSEFVPDLTHPDDIPRVQEYLQREFPGFSMERR